MEYTESDFRAMARETLKGRWKTAILLTIAAVLLGAMTSVRTLFEFKFESESGFVFTILDEFSFNLVQVGVLSVILAIVILVWGIVRIIIGGAMTLGYNQFYQNLVRKEEARVSTLFVHRDKLWHGFCLNFWQVLYVFLWTLCLIIPGIMAGYSYAMAPFIANDHPELTARQVLAASKEMMHGHRWRLFWLEFTFIGWELLAALTLGIGSFAVAPYVQTAVAHFYQDLCNHGMRLEESILEGNDWDNNGY